MPAQFKLLLCLCCSFSIPGSPGSLDPTYFSTPVNCKHLRIEKEDSDEELMLVCVCFFNRCTYTTLYVTLYSYLQNYASINSVTPSEMSHVEQK